MSIDSYIVSIGLEVHVQLKTKSKMFCSCPTSFGDEPNTNTCPTCLGFPGALPVLNKKAIESTILIGQLLGCDTPEIVKWDRKNYFYPDMPKNYQISQMDFPLCLGGAVPLYELAYPKDAQKNIANPDKKVSLTRIHLEEDVAKSTHQKSWTSIDFNRAGTPLMEIVSEPEIDSAEEAVSYLNSLRQILVYSGVSDADMEKGQMRCDVNISLRKNSYEGLGTKIELKNLNSTSSIRRAIKYEIKRQAKELDSGNLIVQATWRWNDDISQTEIMRTKENSHDYRYFPDPDLLSISTVEILNKVKNNIPELPHEKVDRFKRDYKISHYDASILASNKGLSDFYEKAISYDIKYPKNLANWTINNLLSELNSSSISIDRCPISPSKLAYLISLVGEAKISNTQAKEVFSIIFSTPDKSIDNIIKEKGFKLIDLSEIENYVDQAISENAGPVKEVEEGNTKAVNFLTGKVMQLSRGKANPKQVTELILKKINN